MGVDTDTQRDRQTETEQSSDVRLELGIWGWMVGPRRAYESPRGCGKSPKAQGHFIERNEISLRKENLTKTKNGTETQETPKAGQRCPAGEGRTVGLPGTVKYRSMVEKCGERKEA